MLHLEGSRHTLFLIAIGLLVLLGILVPTVVVLVVYKETFLADAVRAGQRLLRGER